MDRSTKIYPILGLIPLCLTASYLLRFNWSVPVHGKILKSNSRRISHRKSIFSIAGRTVQSRMSSTLVTGHLPSQSRRCLKKRRLDWARSHALTNALKACATLINTQNTQELISPVGFLAERVDLAKSLDTLYQVNDDELRAKGDLSFITPLKLNMDKYIPGGRVPRLAWEERKGVKKHAFVWEEEAEHGKEDQRLHPQLQGSFYSFGAALHPRYKMRRWVGSGL
ncbi:hypothetical protein T439DRAFT_329055 [Meredithblackwellia eburnea MCA 4105]